jgi:hypothetical protein
MKTTRILVCLILIALVSPLTAQAIVLDERQQKAERYYQKGDFKKAYKSYYKLAKAGDHFSQSRVAQMFAKGQGTKIDLIEAYAWAELAREGDLEDIAVDSDALLQQVDDKAEAEKKAEKLMKKYGEQALRKKAAKKKNRNIGSCTGSRIACYGS